MFRYGYVQNRHRTPPNTSQEPCVSANTMPPFIHRGDQFLPIPARAWGKELSVPHHKLVVHNTVNTSLSLGGRKPLPREVPCPSPTNSGTLSHNSVGKPSLPNINFLLIRVKHRNRKLLKPKQSVQYLPTPNPMDPLSVRTDDKTPHATSHPSYQNCITYDIQISTRN